LNGGRKKKMITKSLLLLAMLAGSASALAPAQVSKNQTNSLANTNAETEKDYAMGVEALITKIDGKTVYEKYDKISFSYEGITTNSFRVVKNGCRAELSVDEDAKTITVNVVFIDNQGSFEIVADNHESITVYFIKQGDKYITSLASIDQAQYNADVIKNDAIISSDSSAERSDVHLSKTRLENVDLEEIDLRNFGIDRAELYKMDLDFVKENAFTLEGIFKFDDDYGVTTPLRGVKVEIHRISEDGTDTIVKTDYTNDDGKVSYTSAVVRINNGLNSVINQETAAETYYFKLFSEGTSIVIRDETYNTYVWQCSPFSAVAATKHEFSYSFTTNNAVGKGFIISQPAILAARFGTYLNNGTELRTCAIDYPGKSSGSYYVSNTINITDIDNSNYLNSRPNSYQDFDVMIHEYGHHFQRTIGHLSKSNGGVHYSHSNAEDDMHDRKNDDGTNKYTEARARNDGLYLAYGEGWATSYSLLAQKHFKDLYQDTKFFGDDRYTAANRVNVGYGNYEVCLGEGAEESITAFIWNLFDGYDANDPTGEMFEFTDDLFMTFSHNAYTFSDFLMNFEDGDPNEEMVGKMLEKLKMAPTNVTYAKPLYLNVAPTFKWTCSGGSRYYSNNEFYVEVCAYGSEGFNYQAYTTTISLDGTPKEANITVPMEDWERILSVGSEQIEVKVTGYVNRCNFLTGGYKTQTYYFDRPTQTKEAPDPITVAPQQWGFAQKYDGSALSTTITEEDVILTTTRLRTGCIEKDQIVLSAKKKKAGSAYFTIESNTPMSSVEYNVSLWSASEGIKASNSTIKVEVLDAAGNWTVDTDLWTDVTLPTNRNEMLNLTTNNTQDIYGIRFAVTAPATGSSNKGRLALRDITFNF